MGEIEPLTLAFPVLRCCEKTMEVMRGSQEALLTIVEVATRTHTQTHARAVVHRRTHTGLACGQVLLYDPLFDWTMNPLKAFYLQQQIGRASCRERV